MRPFLIAVIAIFTTFMGLMVFVTGLAYSRPSGRSTVSMAKIQEMRALSARRVAESPPLAER